MNGKDVLIQVRDLEKHFDGGSIRALNGVSADIRRGEVVVVIGPSGSGKSTFLRCLNLLERPTGGAVVFDGVDITDPKVNIDLHRQKMGMVFQHFNLFPNMTIRKNITLAPVRTGLMKQEEADELAGTLLQRVDLTDKADAYPSQLSGGQKQRISLARALAVRPAILILDDTTSAVDMETEKQIQHSLNELDFPCTKIIIAQRISTTKYADKILVLQDGRITESGSHEELIAKKGYYYQVVQLQTGQQISEQSRDVSGAYAECGKEV